MTRLRALVVLPTRDLVTQVRETFEAVGKGRGLKIGSVTGQHSFAHEQSQIIAETSKQSVSVTICIVIVFMHSLQSSRRFEQSRCIDLYPWATDGPYQQH